MFYTVITLFNGPFFFSLPIVIIRFLIRSFWIVVIENIYTLLWMRTIYGTMIIIIANKNGIKSISRHYSEIQISVSSNAFPDSWSIPPRIGLIIEFLYKEQYSPSKKFPSALNNPPQSFIPHFHPFPKLNPEAGADRFGRRTFDRASFLSTLEFGNP